MAVPKKKKSKSWKRHKINLNFFQINSFFIINSYKVNKYNKVKDNLNKLSIF